MKRRGFLQLLAAAPIAAMAPWQPPTLGPVLVPSFQYTRWATGFSVRIDGVDAMGRGVTLESWNEPAGFPELSIPAAEEAMRQEMANPTPPPGHVLPITWEMRPRSRRENV